MSTGRSRTADQMTAGWSRLRLITGSAVCAATVAAAGCGSVAAPGGATSPAAGAAGAAKVSVTITVRGPGAAARHWTLRCDPPGGTHPDPASACEALLRDMKPLAAGPQRMACPMILAYPEQATISGTWFGRKVHRVVVDGGCDVRLWTDLGKVFN